MTCPVCGEATLIMDTWRYSKEVTIRRRKCKACENLFYSKEEEVTADYWGSQKWKTNRDRKPPGRRPEWNIYTGARLYAAGVEIGEIARRLNTTYNTVYQYARKHWLPSAVLLKKRRNDNG